MIARRVVLSLAASLLLIPAASAEEARGRIVQIDPDKKLLRVEGVGPWRGMVLDLKIDPKTQILIGGQPATLDDLAAARRVRVTFEQRDGKPVARVVRSLGLMRLAQPAQQPPQAPQPRPAAPLKEGEGIAGTLQRVALTDREIVVIGPGAKGARTETTVAVPEGAAIIRDGKKIALDDLKEGESVTVRTEMRKGQLTALSIQSGQAAAAPAPPPQRRPVIPRLRQALKLADELLREMEEQGGLPPERP